MKRHLFLAISCLAAINATTANAGPLDNVYISLDGVNPAPSDVNIVAGTSQTIYIITTVDRYVYGAFWGTYWGVEPWEKVVMDVPVPHPAAGGAAEVIDMSFDPYYGTSYDYYLLFSYVDYLSAGIHFSTVITVIGEPNDKFEIGLCENVDPWPLVQEVIFTIVPECYGPYYTLTINAEPNDVNTIEPIAGQHEICSDRPFPIMASPYPDCPAVYKFDHWVGDVNDINSAETTILMDGNKTITAYFIDQRECGDLCHPILQGDLNEDCYVDFEDFALYCEKWLSCTHPDCD